MSWMNYQFSRKDHRYRRIYRYEAPWTVYAMNWSVRADQPFRLALGSFIEDYENKVQVVRLASDWVDTRGDIVCNYTLQHPYPPTKIMWIPDPQGIHPDLLATSADHLRVWRCLSPCEVIPAASRARGSIHRVQELGGSVSQGRGRGITSAAAEIIPSAGRARGSIYRVQEPGGSVSRGRGRGILSVAAELLAAVGRARGSIHRVPELGGSVFRGRGHGITSAAAKVMPAEGRARGSIHSVQELRGTVFQGRGHGITSAAAKVMPAEGRARGSIHSVQELRGTVFQGRGRGITSAAAKVMPAEGRARGSIHSVQELRGTVFQGRGRGITSAAAKVMPAEGRARGSIHSVQELRGSVFRGRGLGIMSAVAEMMAAMGRARGSMHRVQELGGSVFRGHGNGIISTTAASTVPATAFDLDLRLECLLNHNENSTPFFSPLTSFDWNATDPCILVTSCIDTTCTIWALETSQVLGQVSGHQREHFSSHKKEVYDVAFGGGRDVFASVSADGSLRLFDLRRLHHSTIVYQEPRHLPLLRLAWNKQDLNYLATLAMDSTEVAILDLRMPGSPVTRLNHHRACVNGLTWAPNSASHICTASDDYQALIWNIQQMPQDVKNPILTHTTNGAINNVQWAAIQTDWIAMCYNNFLELLRVQGPDLG